MLSKLSIASTKYINIFSSQGGPISELYSKPRQIAQDVNGFEAYAQICPDLMEYTNENFIYGHYAGTGSDKFKFIAQHKAISEALERWAFSQAISNGEKARYGFDVEPSTSGMAAFPGFTSRGAREIALFEAVERWSIVNWWNGNLASKAITVIDRANSCGVVEILTPWSKNSSTIILYSNCSNSSRTAYGFAAHQNRKLAITKAEIELFRNKLLLSNISPNLNFSDLKRRNERRLIYFSSVEGHEHFKQVLYNSMKVGFKNDIPGKLVDREIKGPWSKYCHVWRILFENEFDSHLSNDVDQFYF